MKLKEIQESISIPVNGFKLEGILSIQSDAQGIVIFSSGGESGRLNTKNNYVANVQNRRGFATLLVDLLTDQEASLTKNRFDIDLLCNRLIAVTKWVKQNTITKGLPIFYFGNSTGAATALKASIQFKDEIRAIVSSGGRLDLVLADLEKVQSPTLLLVGGLNSVLLQLNRKAYVTLKCKKDMEIIPGTSHLFEEPGKMNEEASLAAMWFQAHIAIKKIAYV